MKANIAMTTTKKQAVAAIPILIPFFWGPCSSTPAVGDADVVAVGVVVVAVVVTAVLSERRPCTFGVQS